MKAIDALELKIPPVALVVITAAGMWAFSRIVPAPGFSVPGAAWWSGGVAITGILISVLGVREFRRAETTVDPRAPEQSASLVTRGVYGYSRNPMYAGFLLVLIGWGLALENVGSLLFVPALGFYLNRFQVMPEERFMRASFRAAYDDYSRRVRRWI